jgi:hypothetical protein
MDYDMPDGKLRVKVRAAKCRLHPPSVEHRLLA